MITENVERVEGRTCVQGERRAGRLPCKPLKTQVYFLPFPYDALDIPPLCTDVPPYCALTRLQRLGRLSNRNLGHTEIP